MEPGKLNKRIIFMEYAEIYDRLGQSVYEWKPYKKVWANFLPVRSGEYQEAEKKNRQEVTYACKCRYVSGITSAMRISFKDRTFEITRIIDVNEENRMLEIECVEYVDKEVDNSVNRDGF